jgi:glycosyltransferase involved in cell wall biosynthesis
MNSTAARERLRLLFLLPFAPRLDALHGGGQVMAQFLAAMTLRHRVALIYLRAPKEPPLDEIFTERCEWVEEVLRPWAGRSLVQWIVRNARLVAFLMRFRPMWVTDWESSSFHDRVRLITHTWQPDIVQIEYHVMGQYLSALDHCAAPRVLVDHEPGVSAAPYLKTFIPIFSHLVQYLDKIAWMRFERDVIRQIQAVVVFTDRDRKALERYGLQTPIWKIPIGTPPPVEPLDALGKSPLSLLFVGNFIHLPNIDAARRLTNKIYPSLRRHYPELDLYIVGDQPPAELKQIADEHIVVTGRVPDITPYLDRAALFVAPIHLGSGMRVKVLEALAAGKAIVASPLAAEGLDVKDGDQISLAENDQEMVNRIDQLLSNPEQRMGLAVRAREWACANLGWEKSIITYEALYRTLLLGACE